MIDRPELRARGAVRGAELGALCMLTVVGLGLRLWMVRRYLDYDEAFTYLTYASGSAWTALSDYSYPNNHVLHSLLLWASVQLLGPGTLGLRLPVLISGVALIPLTHLLARKLAGPSAGLIAAALVSGGTLFCDYSVAARGYMLQAALFTAALLLVPALAQRVSASCALLLALLVGLGLFTVPTLLYALPVPLLWGAVLTASRNQPHPQPAWPLEAVLLGVLIAALLYSPAIAYVRDYGVSWGRPHDATIGEALVALLDFFLGGLPSGAGACVVGLVALDAVLEAWQERRLPLAVLWIGVPLLMLAVHLSLVTRAPFARNFVFLAPLACALGARAAQRVWSIVGQHARSLRLARTVTALAITAVMLWTAVPAGRAQLALERRVFPNTRYLFEHLVRPLQPGDDLSAPAAQLLPMIVYARDAGIPLVTVLDRFALMRVQRTRGDYRVELAGKRSEQRFWMLAKSARERDLLPVPQQVREQLASGQSLWRARETVPSAVAPAPVLWELAPRAP